MTPGRGVSGLLAGSRMQIVLMAGLILAGGFVVYYLGPSGRAKQSAPVPGVDTIRIVTSDAAGITPLPLAPPSPPRVVTRTPAAAAMVPPSAPAAAASASERDTITAVVIEDQLQERHSAPIADQPKSWPGVQMGGVLVARPATAVCEDGLKRGLLLEMSLTEALALADGGSLPPGTMSRVKVADVRKASGPDPTVARLELDAINWNGTWHTVKAVSYRIPFERKRSIGSSALRGSAIGAAGGAVVSIVFKTDLAQSVLVGAAAGAAVGAATAGGGGELPCIDPAATQFEFIF